MIPQQHHVSSEHRLHALAGVDEISPRERGRDDIGVTQNPVSIAFDAEIGAHVPTSDRLHKHASFNEKLGRGCNFDYRPSVERSEHDSNPRCDSKARADCTESSRSVESFSFRSAESAHLTLFQNETRPTRCGGQPASGAITGAR